MTRASLHPLHDVLVGEQVAVGRHHDAGACAAAGPLGLGRAANIDAHHRGADGLDGADHGGGVGIERSLTWHCSLRRERVVLEHARTAWGPAPANSSAESRGANSCENRHDVLMIPLPRPQCCSPPPSSPCRLFRLLRLSSILGYVAAGLAIGPWGLNLVGDVAT